MVEIGTVKGENMTPGGGTCVVPISEPIMRAIIAVAEQPEDPFRLICIETLTEICVYFSSKSKTNLTVCLLSVD